MSFSITLSTNNFSGQTGIITFYPANGGVINIGSQILPYTYVTDYPFGDFDIFLPDFNKTCLVEITEGFLLQEDTNFILDEDDNFIKI